jgi:antitoxin FitA
MATLHALNIPDELYAQLQDLAKADNSSVEAQVIKIIQEALQKIAEEQEKRKNVL